MIGLNRLAMSLLPLAALLYTSVGNAQSAPTRTAPVSPAPLGSPPVAAPDPSAPLPPANAAPNVQQSVAPAQTRQYLPPSAPPAGQPPYVIVEPNSGQALMPAYGPIARAVPSELPYVEGGPVPRGYALEEYHSRGLIISGAVTLGTLYALSLSAAAGGNFNRANGWLAVPIVGPFGWLAARKAPVCQYYDVTDTCRSDEDSKRAIVTVDGLGQVAGAALLIAGLSITRKHLVLVNPQDAVIVAPYASSTGSGLRVIGRF